MRGESRVGPKTRVEVVTEGILTRRIHRDPTLEGVGVVIFDEFHERSLDSDLGLALTLRTQSMLREDLRIVVMSATFDGEAAAQLLGGAPIITSEGRQFPIETRYVDAKSSRSIEAAVAATISEAIRRDSGDILVFLPGAREIRRVEQLLAERDVDDGVIHSLYGALPYDAQNRAIQPDPNGRRKIVLSTSIAETSLTIEGIGVVIDSGLSRVPRFSPRTGMTRLDTVRVSRASADQRRGRAGRVSSGVCYRLWPEYENAHLLANTPPEIASADLAPLALDLAAAGVSDPLELRWIDPPAPSGFVHAVELLRELDAVDDGGTITPHGRELSALPVHPRLAHMLTHARTVGATAVACDLAALLSERDIFRGSGAPVDADISFRLDVLRHAGEKQVLRSSSRRSESHQDEGWWSLPPGAELDRDMVRRVRSEADRLRRQIIPSSSESHSVADTSGVAGSLLALAYPDRVAQRRPGSRARFLLRNGRGAELPVGQTLSTSPYIVAAELDDQRPESRVFLAAAIALDEIREAFATQIVVDESVEFDDTSAAVVARKRERLGAIVLREASLANPDAQQVQAALIAEVRRRGLSSLPWSDAARRLRERIAFVAHHETGWPSLTDDALAASIDDWLGPSLSGISKWSEVERVDLAAALSTVVDWRQRRALDELAPTHIEVPTGAHLHVDYSDPAAPVLAARIQELFGMADSPRVMRGTVTVTMHLLSPARRPVQVTQDLAGFWRSSYFDVRKDLRGRYPKHAWPEDPTTAVAKRRS